MWAIQYHQYGGPSVLRREEIPIPALRRDEVLVETVSSGVSQIDLMYRSGQLRLHGGGFPKQPGFDALGVVRESRVPSISPGRWVWTVLGIEPARRRGTAVEMLALRSDRLGVFPDGCVPEAAAGSLPLGALTALRSLRDGARLAAGERVLVVGAAGAVGIAALQLAQTIGAEVDAVCGPRGLELCSRLGARTVFDHTEHSIVSVQRAAAYDVVLVAAGRGTDWLGALRPDGRAVLTRADQWIKTLPSALRQHRRARGVAAGHRSTDLTWLAGEVAGNRLCPVVDKTYMVDELARAHEEHGSDGAAGARLVLHQK